MMKVAKKLKEDLYHNSKQIFNENDADVREIKNWRTCY